MSNDLEKTNILTKEVDTLCRETHSEVISDLADPSMEVWNKLDLKRTRKDTSIYLESSATQG